jgi:hypothetical protein
VTDLARLTADDVEPLVGTDFAVVDRPGQAALRLTSVRRSGRRIGTREGFALLFSGSGSEPMPQDTYALRHPDLGELAIFIVPVGAEPGGFSYEAVFS